MSRFMSKNTNLVPFIHWYTKSCWKSTSILCTTLKIPSMWTQTKPLGTPFHNFVGKPVNVQRRLSSNSFCNLWRFVDLRSSVPRFVSLCSKCREGLLTCAIGTRINVSFFLSFPTLKIETRTGRLVVVIRLPSVWNSHAKVIRLTALISNL